MSSPSLKDLPRVEATLKSQLEEFNPKKLKDVATEEKIVLPTAEGKYQTFNFSISNLGDSGECVDEALVVMIYPVTLPRRHPKRKATPTTHGGCL